MGSSHKRKVQG